MSDDQSIISSLYLPMSQYQLLLPNVSVAEVVGFQEPKMKSNAPDYFLGFVEWRGVDIPVISYEAANGSKQVSHSNAARLAVINTIGEHHDALPFFAVVTQGIPRLVKVSDDLIKVVEKKKGDADAVFIKVDGEEAAIPNLEFLESLAFQHM